MSNIYRDDPPTEPGWYWVRPRVGRREYVAERNPDGIWDISCGSAYATDVTAAEVVQFGPRVPDPLKCAEIERGSDEYKKETAANRVPRTDGTGETDCW